jgi:hypothetical protein
MDYDLNFKVTAEPLPNGKIHEIGSAFKNANVVIRTSENEKLLYLDGACEGDAPLYLGITKSRGSQNKKLPVQTNDFLGGLQIYARSVEGSSVGYCPEETPLVAGIQFKVSNIETTSIPTEMLLALSDEQGLSVKLIVDKDGNLRTTGSLSAGNLTITDEEVHAGSVVTYVKVVFNNRNYALPLHLINS